MLIIQSIPFSKYTIFLNDDGKQDVAWILLLRTKLDIETLLRRRVILKNRKTENRKTENYGKTENMPTKKQKNNLIYRNLRKFCISSDYGLLIVFSI